MNVPTYLPQVTLSDFIADHIEGEKIGRDWTVRFGFDTDAPAGHGRVFLISHVGQIITYQGEYIDEVYLVGHAALPQLRLGEMMRDQIAWVKAKLTEETAGMIAAEALRQYVTKEGAGDETAVMEIVRPGSAKKTDVIPDTDTDYLTDRAQKLRAQTQITEPIRVIQRAPWPKIQSNRDLWVLAGSILLMVVGIVLALMLGSCRVHG